MSIWEGDELRADEFSLYKKDGFSKADTWEESLYKDSRVKEVKVRSRQFTANTESAVKVWPINGERVCWALKEQGNSAPGILGWYFEKHINLS